MNRQPRIQLKELSSTKRNTFLKLVNQGKINSSVIHSAYNTIMKNIKKTHFPKNVVNLINKYIETYEKIKPKAKAKAKAKANVVNMAICRPPTRVMALTGNFEYIHTNGKFKRIPIQYLMFVDTLHDILEGDRAFNLKQLMKQEVSKRLQSWANGYMQLGTVTFKAKYIEYMKYVVNPFQNSQRIKTIIDEALPAIIGSIQFPNRLQKITEPSVHDLKYHYLELVKQLVVNKVGTQYKAHPVQHQHEMQEFIKTNKWFYSIDSTKRNVHEKASALEEAVRYNIQDHYIITAAQIFDSATTGSALLNKVYINLCNSPPEIEKPYGLNGTYIAHYQGSIVQIGNRFDMYVLVLKNEYNIGNNFQKIDKCLFIAKRIPLAGRTQIINERVRENIFLNTVIIGKQGITPNSLNNGDYEHFESNVHYNQLSGVCVVNEYRGLSIKELTNMLTTFVGDVDPVMRNICINTVFDWKRQQDSFQMVFSKILNDNNIKHCVFTVDLLAFAFGVYYGTNVILQTGVSYYIYETSGEIKTSNVQLLKNTANQLFTTIHRTEGPKNYPTFFQGNLNMLLNTENYSKIIRTMNLRGLEINHLKNAKNVTTLKNRLQRRVNEITRQQMNTSQKNEFTRFINTLNFKKFKQALLVIYP